MGKNNKITQSGFSIIELLTVIVIIGIITTLTIVNLREGDNIARLNAAVEQIITKIEENKNNALTGKNGDTVRGYGIVLDESSGSDDTYILYQDSDPFSCENDGTSYSETFSLPQDIYILSVDLQTPFFDETYTKFCFQTYTGVVFHNGSLLSDMTVPITNDNTLVEITLADKKTSDTITFTLNTLGLVEKQPL